MKRTLKDFPEIAKQWHPIKNYNLIPDEVRYRNNNKVWWICDRGHEWEAKVCNRTTGQGCPYCYGRKTCIDNCLATTHPSLVKQWHPTKNGDLKPNQISFGSHKKVWWKCPRAEDHEWQAKILAGIVEKPKEEPKCKHNKKIEELEKRVKELEKQFDDIPFAELAE